MSTENNSDPDIINGQTQGISHAQFIKDFIDNLDFDNAKHGVIESKLKVHAVPIERKLPRFNLLDSSSIIARKLSCKSEIALSIESGNMNYQLTYNLKIDVPDDSLLNESHACIAQLHPKIYLSQACIEGHDTDLFGFDAATGEILETLFDDANFSIHQTTKNSELELILRQAVVKKMAKALKKALKQKDYQSHIIATITDVSKSCLIESVSAVQSLINAYPMTHETENT